MTGDGGARGPWDAVVGQAAAVAALRSAIAADEVGHAWLVVGRRLVGQDALATAFGAALNCLEPPTPGDACGDCDACRRILRGVHPVVRTFAPEGAAHLVEDVRDVWTDAATRSAPDGRRKLLRILEADAASEAAQNAFLKVLEEPPPSVVWVLDVEDPSRLLETVVSRCRRLDLAPWGPAELERWAVSLGVAGEEAPLLARAAMGSPQRVADLADPDVAAARARHLGLVAELAGAGPGVVVPLAKELVTWARSRSEPLKRRHEEELARLEEAFGAEGPRGWPPGVRQRVTKRFERLERAEQHRALGILLDDLGSWVRDLIAVAAGVGPDGIVNVDHADALRRDAGLLAPEDLIAASTAVVACRGALARNGAPELHLERLLMAIAVPLYARQVRVAS